MGKTLKLYRSLVKEPKSIQEKVGRYVVKRESVVNLEGLFGNYFGFRMKGENVKKSSQKPGMITYAASKL